MRTGGHGRGTVHLAGASAEIVESERACWDGRYAERPFVLLAQQSGFDPTRAPPGKHTAWAYCHVPYGSPKDVRGPIDAQIERFAPGFRDLIIAATARVLPSSNGATRTSPAATSRRVPVT